MKKSSYAWLFAVIILSVLLILALALGLSGFFFSVSMTTAPTDINLGEVVTIEVMPNQSEVVSFGFDGGYVPNEKLAQIIQIKAKELDTELNLRVKAVVHKTNEVVNLKFDTTENFIEGNDGYYYYNGTLAGGNKVTFCNYIIMPEEAKFLSRERYILSVLVENLETDYDARTIWNIDENLSVEKIIEEMEKSL